LGKNVANGNRHREIEDLLSARRIGKFCIRWAAVSKSALRAILKRRPRPGPNSGGYSQKPVFVF
jgi:hypothetical protein